MPGDSFECLVDSGAPPATLSSPSTKGTHAPTAGHSENPTSTGAFGWRSRATSIVVGARPKRHSSWAPATTSMVMVPSLRNQPTPSQVNTVTPQPSGGATDTV